MIVMSLMAVLVACGSSKSEDNKPSGSPSAQASQPAGAEANAPEQSQAGDDEVTITKEQYGKIKSGMTYKEIIEIVGGEGELLSESGNEGDEIYASVVMYKGKGSVGASASFVFLNGELQTKSQMGLE